MPEYFPSVVQVVPYEDFSVDVYFIDGKIVKYDMLPFINEGKEKNNIFAKIADIDTFMAKCTVMNETLAWDIGGNRDTYNCIDIDPLEIYDNPKTKERITLYSKNDKSEMTVAEKNPKYE